ncbi:hypothetical protein ONE63_011052 [Megalurothrips usitatus]|uniref:SUN domain-containing protein n=1 Tax=Megalurothrips usitatus TaxID=439358 RepID=A0AAV7XJ22_9NEOP|nr:hypothetical protein ONE63_011052 [Megalurothrips usitatus]
MKFCRLVYYVFIVQFINSCIAESVTKTEAPANSAGNAIINTLNNDTLVHVGAEPVTTNTITVDSLQPDTFTESSAEISENVGQASQIQSSFEEVPKPKAPIDDVAINDKLPGVLNQGTLSQDVADTGTIGVVSLSDSASADLHQLASSASANVNTESKSDQTGQSNGTAGSLPPIVILPTGEPEQSTDLPPKKTESTPSPHPPTTDQPQPPVIRAEPKVVEQTTLKDEEKLDLSMVQNEAPPLQDSQNSAKPSEAASPPPSPTGSPLDIVTVPSSEIPQEEIPSFSEWTQKQLEEAEKKKGQNKTASPPISRGPAPSKMRSKNYASPDCGAKIVATNPEAENPSGVLANSKDEYLINRCSTQRMWVIIELCEAVQAKKIELANFELFSSSPKDFSVYLSHTFPSRDWTSVGQFTAKDERTVQSFNLHPHLFGKFLKVEFNSHYGKEHFCCTSLIRVYGTSEFEVLETENEVHSAGHDDEDEDEDEQPIGADTGKPTKNLFGHATDAVYTIVRKAAEVLVKSSDSQNQSQTLERKNSTALIPAYRVRPRHCNTLRHLVVCNNCSEDFFDRVYHLLSCQSSELQVLIESPFVFDGINNSQLCSLYGLDFIEKRNLALPLRLRHEDQLDQAGYLAAMLPAEYISALCNILAVLEGKVVLNNSQAASAYQGATLVEDARDSELKKLLIEHQPAQTCSMDTSFTLSHCQPGMSGGSSEPSVGVTSFPGNQPGASSLPSLASEIKPTRTLTKEEAKGMSVQDGSAQQVPVQKSGTPDVTATKNTPIDINVEPSAILVSINAPAESLDNIKLSSAAPETTQETVILEQPVLEVPPVEKERDFGDTAFTLDSGTSDDQDSTKDLDAIFMEMKALDNNEETSTETSGSASTPSSVVTQTRVPTGQAQKESVFLRLSNKIKALERNMSLSGQYLEELSRRYKKQEELSRALNKTIVLLREEIRKSKDREQQRDSDLHFLRTQLIQVAATIESYQSERDSWQHKAVVMSQHFILIVIEVVMFGVVVWMCRRIPSDTGLPSASAPQRKWSTGWRKGNKSHVKHMRRRSSLDDLNSSTDLRKRRPSEEALKISGSYQDLMLQEENVIIVEGEDLPTVGDDSSSWLAVSNSKDQRRKRKRRKEGLVRSSSSNNLQVMHSQTMTRKISAPLHSYSVPAGSCDSDKTNMQSQHAGVFPSNVSPVQTERETFVSEAAFVPACSPFSVENGGAGSDPSNIPGTFMETATSTRHRRSFNLVEAQLPFHVAAAQDWKNHVEGDSGSSASGQSSRSKGLDSLEPVGNSSLGDSPAGVYEDKKKKLNKKGGLKNMVKKFF